MRFRLGETNAMGNDESRGNTPLEDQANRKGVTNSEATERTRRRKRSEVT